MWVWGFWRWVGVGVIWVLDEGEGWDWDGDGLGLGWGRDGYGYGYGLSIEYGELRYGRGLEAAISDGWFLQWKRCFFECLDSSGLGFWEVCDGSWMER